VSRRETRAEIQVVPDAEATAAPEDFIECARGMSEQQEFVDSTGEHIWIALDAYLDALNLLPRGILVLADGGNVGFQQTSGFVLTGSMAISTASDLPIVAMEYSGKLETFGVDGLAVESGGPTALSSTESCGSFTSTALTFTADGSPAVAANGETVELQLNGVDSLATNIYTVVRDEPLCTDTVGAGLDATWLYVDGSL
jgi:hypothetical protein